MHKLTNKLIEEFGSRDPVYIAEKLGIHIIVEDLGTINGYYNEVGDIKFIHINQNLSDEEMIFTAAHELGHSLLHERTNAMFLNAFTRLNTEKLEIEANTFATHLLISDDEVEHYKHLPVPTLMEMYNLDENLIRDRFFS